MRRRSAGRAFRYGGRVPVVGVVAAVLAVLVVGRPADGAEAPPGAQAPWNTCAIGGAAVTVVSSYPRAGAATSAPPRVQRLMGSLVRG